MPSPHILRETLGVEALKEHGCLQAAENFLLVRAGLKPLNHLGAVNAALEALRHPKPEFFPYGRSEDSAATNLDLLSVYNS
jgi:hypothetical protein